MIIKISINISDTVSDGVYWGYLLQNSKDYHEYVLFNIIKYYIPLHHKLVLGDWKPIK